MRKVLVVSLLFVMVILAFGTVSLYQHRPSAHTPGGCIDISANPDYLSSGSSHDAIAAINNARQDEQLRPLRLPAKFYQLDPSQQQFVLLNLERTDRGLKPLQMDANLSQMALAYSIQLRDLHFFSHTSPIAGTFGDRINSNPAIADHYSLAAENLAGNPVPGVGPIYEYMYDDSIENCGHRHNILNPALTLVGINWVHGGQYGSLSAQEFLTPAPWSPYIGSTTTASTLAIAPQTPTPIVPITPQLTISVSPATQNHMLQYQSLAIDPLAVTRITWFLDSLSHPLAIGPLLTLDMRRLPAGKHSLLVYAVDIEGNFGMARYVIGR